MTFSSTLYFCKYASRVIFSLLSFQLPLKESYRQFLPRVLLQQLWVECLVTLASWLKKKYFSRSLWRLKVILSSFFCMAVVSSFMIANLVILVANSAYNDTLLACATAVACSTSILLSLVSWISYLNQHSFILESSLASSILSFLLLSILAIGLPFL